VLLLLDTSIAIEVRDRNLSIADKLEALEHPVAISAITRVELEGGVYRESKFTQLRRQRLDVFLAFVPVLAFSNDVAIQYGSILAACGFSRRKILDRMIGAHAIAVGAMLVTLNPADFNDIPNLEVLAW
jgi:tRNA(fMet)-specific endonuclease VapC